VKKVCERLYFIIFLFISIISVDQLTKYFIRKTFILGESKEILGSFFRFTFVFNPYAAFGLSLGPKWIYYLFVFLAIALIVYYFIKNYSKANEFEILAGSMIIAGAISNMIDRLAMGKVTDFIDFGIGIHRYPYFNIADSSVVIGAIILLYSLSFIRKNEK